ncbi:UDP-N-acetyl glucosamine 2-epimerase [Streptomyces sp. SB3404]|uniref:UDP-N-acetyl glucosamine 2-epimerase n=1 Tax=Streptomyces boncukensis TaxID=2711219 RepID=A0A6G4X1M6_9ACTN|nr:UDP-N-acetyl glucosamine 2-epimerase [Streptomyces boncukensis]
MLFAVRNATALHRLLDAAPALADDSAVVPVFTLVPGSDFDADALAALDGRGARCVPWDEARATSYDLILAASANGVGELSGPLVLLPHGAGFGKRVPYARGADSANGLSPDQLLRPDGTPVARLHALPHPDERARLAAEAPAAARPAAVVGDPTLDRILESVPRRARYRAALGTGGRRLVAVLSTWGPESLLERRPELPARLAATLPYDAFQVALVLHPNERARHGEFALRQRLARLERAHVVLAGGYEEWGAVLVAADCVITDHGSTALYAAALDRPVVSAYDGGGELLPGTPIARLLRGAPYLDDARPYAPQLERALTAHEPGVVRAHAGGAFAEPGHALERLRESLYGLLELPPPEAPAQPAPLPPPRPDTGARVAAFAVESRVRGNTAEVTRHPAAGAGEGGWLAAEADWAGSRYVQGARLLYRYAAAGEAPGWCAEALAAYPVCRTAAVLTPDGGCAVRTRGGPLRWLRFLPPARGSAPDPVAVLCGVHAWLAEHPEADGPGERPGRAAGVRCRAGGRTAEVVAVSLPR